MREGSRVTAGHVTRERDHVTGVPSGRSFSKSSHFSTSKMWRMLTMLKLYILKVVLNKLYDDGTSRDVLHGVRHVTYHMWYVT